MLKKACFVLAGVLALASTALAGQIGYRRNGGTTQTITVSNNAPYTSIEIDLGEITSNTTLHIFDIVTGGDPTDSVGMITLRGYMSNSAIPLFVAIADGGVALPMRRMSHLRRATTIAVL